MGIEDLYQQIILDHYRNPRHQGTLEHPTVDVAHNNPLCGDRLHVQVRIEDGRIADIAHSGEGCSISQASASMMADAAVGKPVDEAMAAIEHVRLLMHGETAADEDVLGDAVALEGVARYPVRVRCALLSWMALKDALQTHTATSTGG
ncbi:MAG: SUF system NifU family Fe-S cluster assembly protein [Thermoleophilia bacterium]